MKAKIHPTYFEEITITCSCGNSFVSGSTRSDFHVEVCHKCHPFFTGEKRFVDTLGQVGKFESKLKSNAELRARFTAKKDKKSDKKTFQPKSLRELLSAK